MNKIILFALFAFLTIVCNVGFAQPLGPQNAITIVMPHRTLSFYGCGIIRPNPSQSPFQILATCSTRQIYDGAPDFHVDPTGYKRYSVTINSFDHSFRFRRERCILVDADYDGFSVMYQVQCGFFH